MLLNQDYVREIEKSDLDYTFSRLDGMLQSPGNPLGVAIGRFGEASAFAIKAWPDFWYGNKVLNVNQNAIADLDGIVAFFREHDLDFRIEIPPFNLSSKLGAKLHQLGFTQMSFSTAVFGFPKYLSPDTTSNSIRIRQISMDELSRFFECYQDGFELPRLNAVELESVHTWVRLAENELYLCALETMEEIAGIGVLFIRNGIGLLADACVKPALRGVGYHTSLIAHRVRVAQELGCELMTSFVQFGSASHRNLERAGMRVAYTKGLWWRV